jgi:hypothetical protein
MFAGDPRYRQMPLWPLRGASAVEGTAIGATFGDSRTDLVCDLGDLGDLESAGGIG